MPSWRIEQGISWFLGSTLSYTSGVEFYFFMSSCLYPGKLSYSFLNLGKLLEICPLCFQWQKNLSSFNVKFSSASRPLSHIHPLWHHFPHLQPCLISFSSSDCISSTTTWMEAVPTSHGHLYLLEFLLHSIQILHFFCTVVLHFCAKPGFPVILGIWMQIS